MTYGSGFPFEGMTVCGFASTVASERESSRVVRLDFGGPWES
jgi:hypothetical protein